MTANGDTMDHGTVLDMQADMGCDPTGTRPCDNALERAVNDDTRLEFPPGRYLFQNEHRFENVKGLGIIGTGADHRDVQFVFPSGYSGIVLGLWHGQNWRVGNFTIQQSMDQRTGVGMEIVPRSDFHMWDVEVAGFSPYNHLGGERGLYCDVLDADGVAVIDRYIHRGPSHVGNYPQGTQAFLADEHHEGTLYCRDWLLENCGENGIYASRTPGRVRVEGGYFKNNEVASIRICGDGSYVKGATVVVDTDHAHPANRGQFENVRGIWWESGTLGKAGGLIENCTLIMRSVPLSQGLLRIERTAGSMTMRDCRLLNETPWATVDVIAPDETVSRGPVEVRAQDLFIEATGTGVPPFRINSRSGSSLEGVTVESTGPQRDGLLVEQTREVTISGGSVVADRYPIKLQATETAETGPCLARIDDHVTIESRRHSGRLLISASAQEGVEESTYCISEEFDTDVSYVVLTELRRAGLAGLLLAQDGQILFRANKPETATD